MWRRPWLCSNRRVRRVASLLLMMLALSVSAEPADAPRPAPAADTGAKHLATRELHTPRFRIRFSPRAEGAAKALAATIEGARQELVGVLGVDWTGETEIRVGISRAELDVLAAPRTLPGWSSAVTFPDENLILIDAVLLSSPQGPATLRHELSHVALAKFGGPWPRWFAEGLAQAVTGERFFFDNYATLFRAVHQERVIPLDELTTGWPDLPSDVDIAYAQSVSFVEYLFERQAPPQMRALLLAVKGGDAFNLAFAKAFHTSLDLEERHWREALPRRFAWLPINAWSSLLWGLTSLLCLVAFWRRQVHKGRKLAVLDAELAAEDSAHRLLAAAEANAEMTKPPPDDAEHPEVSGVEDEEEPSDVSDEDAEVSDPDAGARSRAPERMPPGKRVLH